MSCKEMQAKHQLIMAKLKITNPEQYADTIVRTLKNLPDESQRVRKSVPLNWVLTGAQIRHPMDKAFLAFCNARGIPFDYGDFGSTAKEYEDKLKGKNRSSDDGQKRFYNGNSHHLIGHYQVIRPFVGKPYVGASNTYILEAMEITVEDGQFRHRMVSHTCHEPEYVYSGPGFAEPRYYFAMLSRQHEEFSNAQAHRCVSFYTEEPRHPNCLSGVMLRGVNGSTGKIAAALPFIALRVTSNDSLTEMNQIAMANANEGAYPLYRVHPDSHLLIGEVRERWYKPIYDICHGIFHDEKFMKATNNSEIGNGQHPPVPGDLIAKTVVPDVLFDLPMLSERHWVNAVKAVAELSKLDN